MVLAAPGEIRKEYEEELRKVRYNVLLTFYSEADFQFCQLEEERRLEQDREEELSRALIERLQREEAVLIAEADQHIVDRVQVSILLNRDRN